MQGPSCHLVGLGRRGLEIWVGRPCIGSHQVERHSSDEAHTLAGPQCPYLFSGNSPPSSWVFGPSLELAACHPKAGSRIFEGRDLKAQRRI